MATEDDENMEETVDEQEAVRDPVGEFESRKRAVQKQAPSSDRNTFKYYFATIGPLSMAVAVFLTGSTGFSSTFRGKSQRVLRMRASMLTHPNSRVGDVVGKRSRT